MHEPLPMLIFTLLASLAGLVSLCLIVEKTDSDQEKVANNHKTAEEIELITEE